MDRVKEGKSLMELKDSFDVTLRVLHLHHPTYFIIRTKVNKTCKNLNTTEANDPL